MVRNISSVSFQLSSSLRTFPIKQLLDRLLNVSSKTDSSVSMFVLLKRISSNVFPELLQNTPSKSKALLSDVGTGYVRNYSKYGVATRYTERNSFKSK